MSIASEITRINNNIANAYTECNSKGATMPQIQNSANLSTTIASIPTGGGGSTARLPEAYQEVTYIESSGTQYFDTEYKPNGNSQYKFKFSNGSTSGVLFGAYNSGWTTGSGYYHNNNSSSYEYFHYWANNMIRNTTGSSLNTYEFYINKGTIYSSTGSIIYSTTNKTFTVNYPLYILAGNWAGSNVEQPLTCRLYYFKIWDDDVLLKDYVPCYRKSDGVIGMYDLVDNEFITNAGTGTFTKGPDHNTPIANLQDKEITITSNTTTTVTADTGYDGLGTVTINVSV